MKVLLLSDGNSIHTFRWAKALVEEKIEVQIFRIFEPRENYWSWCDP